LKKPASAASGDEALQNRAPRLADMEAAKRNNSAQFASKFRADAQFCIEALEQLERVADARLGDANRASPQRVMRWGERTRCRRGRLPVERSGVQGGAWRLGHAGGAG
jgi:hypothetical protein